LNQRLQDRDYAAAYLRASSEEGLETFLVAVGDVMRARGFSHVSSKAALNREHLYRAFSKKGNPSIETLWSVMDAVDMRLTVVPHKKRAAE
jgi:probable addiction module antidote protein